MKTNNISNNIIKFDKYAKPSLNYKKILKDFANELEYMSEICFSTAINLALSGKWKKWDESMSIGLNFNFDEGMLFETGDKNVTDIVRLRLEILETLDRIRGLLSTNKTLNNK